MNELTIKQKIILLLNKIWQFLKTGFFLKNAGAAVVFVILIILLSMLFLRLYTLHGSSINIPDFRGRTMKEVLKLADEKDLRIEILDSVFTSYGRKGTVVDQIPKPNTKVKKNRRIFITLKAYNAEMIKMPNLRGLDLIQAKADLETYGLQIEKLNYQNYEYRNNVYEQYYRGKVISPGALIEKGSKISLVVGMGRENTNTIIPDLEGLDEIRAGLLAAEYSINIGRVLYDSTVKTDIDSLVATVYKQYPPKNTNTKLGSVVDIWLKVNNESSDDD